MSAGVKATNCLILVLVLVAVALAAYGGREDSFGRSVGASTTPDHQSYLPLLAKGGDDPTPTPSPTPVAAIVLADRPGGLELISAPMTLPLTVGHVAYLPVEVLGYHRPITVSAQTLIHTYINDQTAAAPGEALTLTVGVVAAARGELKLQTLRMRPHVVTLTFQATGASEAPVASTLTLAPVVQPRAPLFGLHSATFYTGIPQPFDRVYGPDCAPCAITPGDPPGSTRDIACAKQRSSCLCHPVQEILDPVAESRVRRETPQMQGYASQFLRSIGGWGGAQHAPGQYHWAALDWLFDSLTPVERDYSPLASGVMDGNYGWMTCLEHVNPDGSNGFFDVNNAFLLAQYAANVAAETDRYAPELRFVELSNEPAAEFYLCPCVAPGGTCDATSGPNQPACLLGPNAPEFVATYGDFLFTAAISGSQAMAAANPDALLITGALEMTANRDHDLTRTTEDMLARGLLAQGNVAIGIHQYPYLYPPNWISPTLNCAYYQKPGDPYWLPPGCETAPPFSDYVTPAGKPIPARRAWQELDRRTDLTGLLQDAVTLGVLDRFYLFDTELHAGWHDGDPTTTPAREAMAGLRIAAINAHQRVLGSQFIFAPADPAAYNLMVKQLAGVTPFYTAAAPLMDADYSGLVYKLFARSPGQVPGTSKMPDTSAGEDIIALWSNAEMAQALTLTLAAGPVQFKQVTLTRFADAGGPLTITTTVLSAPPAAITVEPLREFYFLSVISDRPGFGWLASF